MPFRNEEDALASVGPVRNHLAQGGIIAYPTETVYGFGCRPVSDDVARLAALKGRAMGKPFLLLAGNRAMVRHLQLELTGFADRLAEAFWPGPVTLVLRGGEATLPDSLRGPEGGIAVRVTSHGTMALLINELGHPVTSTSANRPGKAPAAGAAGIVDAFGEGVAEDILVLDGGVLGNVPPSTVVDCTTAHPRIVRSGAISRDDVFAVAAGRGS